MTSAFRLARRPRAAALALAAFVPATVAAFEPYVTQAPLQVELRVLSQCTIDTTPARAEPAVSCLHPLPVRIERLAAPPARFSATPLAPGDGIAGAASWQITF